MSTSTRHVYGEFVGAHHLEAAILDTLWYWLPSYCYEVSREAGLGAEFLQPIRGWRVASDMERFPEDQLPCVVLVNNGVTIQPRKHAIEEADVFLAHWEVMLGVQVAAKGSKAKAVPRALTLARMYSLALRLVMIQKRDEDGVMGMTDPMSERPNQTLSIDDDRTTCLAVTTFSIVTDKWAEWGNGPMEPEQPPPEPNRPEWPYVEEWDLEVTKIPVDADVTPHKEEG